MHSLTLHNNHDRRDLAADNPERVKKLVRLMFYFAVPIGILCTVINIVVPTFNPGIFTQSKLLQGVVRTVTVQSGLSQLLIFVATMLDGVCIGTMHMRDYITARFVIM